MKCFIARWRISDTFNKRRQVSDAVNRHVAECPACRRFHAGCRTLSEKLAPEDRDAGIPDRLHQRIMASVREVRQDSRVLGPAHGRPALIAGVAVAALVAIAFVAVMWQRDRALQATSEADAVAALITANAGGYGAATVRAVRRASVAVGSPMNEEMDNLKQDLSRAAGYLLACLE
jgi:hypothetical protein